jgi:hypothetical protein
MATPIIKTEPVLPGGGQAGEFTWNGEKYNATTWLTYFDTNEGTDPFIRTQFTNLLYQSGYFDTGGSLYSAVGRTLWQRVGEWAAAQSKANKPFTLTLKNIPSGIKSAATSETRLADFGGYLKGSSGTGATDTTNENQNESYYQVKLRQFAFDNGIVISAKDINAKARQIAFNKNNQATTFDEVTQYYRDKVIAPKYSQFADDIKGGTDVRDLANDYIAMISDALEIDPEKIDLAKDPLLSKALLGYAGTGGKKTYPNYTDFQQMVRQDKRWQYTNNAKDALTDTAQSIKQIFGL